jgi:hypothetical protein
MQKLMTAVTVVALCVSLQSLIVARSATKRLDRDLNRVALVVSNTDRLIDLVDNIQTNEMKLHSYIKQVDDELGTEIKDRRALEAVVEQNAKELIRISGNLERDVDKMYTNIVMFGVSVFDVRNDMADLALRIQDLERLSIKPSVPTVPAAVVPAPVKSESEKLKERFDIGPADLGPAPEN